jgi:hypothetical protein
MKNISHLAIIAILIIVSCTEETVNVSNEFTITERRAMLNEFVVKKISANDLDSFMKSIGGRKTYGKNDALPRRLTMAREAGCQTSLIATAYEFSDGSYVYVYNTTNCPVPDCPSGEYISSSWYYADRSDGGSSSVCTATGKEFGVSKE